MSAYYGYGYGLPKAVKYLLIANAVVFALQVILPNFPTEQLGLVPALVNSHFAVWQFFTYMFLHGGFMHIGFNMFALWMFGTELEYNWGTRDFLKFYFACGIGGGIMVWLTSMVGLSPYLGVTIGASGAIFGLLVAYGLMWPDRLILLFGILPMKALQFVIIFGAIDLFQGLTGTGGNTAVFAHVGGGLTGFIYLKFWWRIQVYFEHFLRRIRRKRFTVVQGGKKNSGGSDEGGDDIDRILDKIARRGMESLTDQERQTLQRASDRKNRFTS
jgi:membrane associated rhomboid family serine protease